MVYEHQTAHNKAFAREFNLVWLGSPNLCILRIEPKLIGNFQEELGFQPKFNSAINSTLYRDYYKFQYGLANGLLSFAVLIVPTNASAFVPSRPLSIRNAAECR